MQNALSTTRNANALQWPKQAIVAFRVPRGIILQSPTMAHSGHMRHVARDTSIAAGLAGLAGLVRYNATYCAGQIISCNNVCNQDNVYLIHARSLRASCETLVPELVASLYQIAQMHKCAWRNDHTKDNPPPDNAYIIAGQLVTVSFSGMCQSVSDCHNPVQLTIKVAIDYKCCTWHISLIVPHALTVVKTVTIALTVNCMSTATAVPSK